MTKGKDIRAAALLSEVERLRAALAASEARAARLRVVLENTRHRVSVDKRPCWCAWQNHRKIGSPGWQHDDTCRNIRAALEETSHA